MSEVVGQILLQIILIEILTEPSAGDILQKEITK